MKYKYGGNPQGEVTDRKCPKCGGTLYHNGWCGIVCEGCDYYYQPNNKEIQKYLKKMK